MLDHVEHEPLRERMAEAEHARDGGVVEAVDVAAVVAQRLRRELDHDRSARTGDETPQRIGRAVPQLRIALLALRRSRAARAIPADALPRRAVVRGTRVARALAVDDVVERVVPR